MYRISSWLDIRPIATKVRISVTFAAGLNGLPVRVELQFGGKHGTALSTSVTPDHRKYQTLLQMGCWVSKWGKKGGGIFENGEFSL